MATITWTGYAPAVAQVNTITVAGTPANGQVYAVVMNGKTISYTATGVDSNTSIATALQALLAVSTAPPEFLEVTWANPSAGVITGTAVTAGIPFTNTSSATGTGTFVTAITTASAGPNDVSTAENYDSGALPTNGDTLYFTNNTSSALYGLDALSAVTLAALYVDASYSGFIGLPQVNASGYWEYRPQYLQVGATLFTCGDGIGGGSGRVKVNFGSVATTANVLGTGSPAEQTMPALILLGTSGSNVLNVYQGSVGTAMDPGNTSTWATIKTGWETNQNTDVTLYIGLGVTLTNTYQYGGTITTFSNLSTHVMTAGTLTLLASATPGTITCDGGTVYWRSTGTMTSGTFRNSGTTLDCQGDPRARTATNLSVTKGAALLDPTKSITFTNPFATDSLSQPNSNYGFSYSLQRS